MVFESFHRLFVALPCHHPAIIASTPLARSNSARYGGRATI